MLLEADASAS
jgi:hypothetical protein